MHMNRLLVAVVITSTIDSVIIANRSAAQIPPPAKQAAKVRITKAPELERTDPDFAIIRWTSTNPGGTDEHFAVVHYGTDPKSLSQLAKSPIRLKQDESETIFRVRMPDLTPGTTYYYTVDSAQANGQSDGIKSPVKKFTTPAPPLAQRPTGK
jgi:hypothetical protein